MGRGYAWLAARVKVVVATFISTLQKRQGLSGVLRPQIKRRLRLPLERRPAAKAFAGKSMGGGPFAARAPLQRVPAPPIRTNNVPR